MTCEQAAQQIVDDLTGNLDPAGAHRLRDHLASCGACRAEVHKLERTWEDLGRLASPTAGPPGIARLADRLAPSGHGPGPARVGPRRRAGSMAVAIAAAAVLGLFVGYQGGQLGSQRAVESGLGSEFLLLLREPAGGLPGSALPSQTELVREYGEWALALEEEGRLVGAERLAEPSGFWLAGAEGRRVAPELVDAPLIDGYFIVRAADAEAVLETARQSPHLKYGGTIEIREIAVN